MLLEFAWKAIPVKCAALHSSFKKMSLVEKCPIGPVYKAL
jgi:hypothetical protein